MSEPKRLTKLEDVLADAGTLSLILEGTEHEEIMDKIACFLVDIYIVLRDKPDKIMNLLYQDFDKDDI